MILADLARVLRAAADEAERIDVEQRQARHDWIDQTKSPLGAKRHNAAVRRLLQAGDAGAAVVGRRHLLSADALQAELARASSKPSKVKTASVGDELRAELRLVGGAR